MTAALNNIISFAPNTRLMYVFVVFDRKSASSCSSASSTWYGCGRQAAGPSTWARSAGSASSGNPYASSVSENNNYCDCGSHYISVVGRRSSFVLTRHGARRRPHEFQNRNTNKPTVSQHGANVEAPLYKSKKKCETIPCVLRSDSASYADEPTLV